MTLGSAISLHSQEVEIETGAIGEKTETSPSENEESQEEAKKPRPKIDPNSKTRTRQTAEERMRPLSKVNRKLERVDSESETEEENVKIGDENSNVTSSFITRTDARTFTLEVPAPRGQILDRKGYPLAQNKVAYYAAVNFPAMEDADETAILRYAGERIVQVNRLLGKRWDLSADIVLKHFENRRWLPLLFSDPLTNSEVKKLREADIRGLLLHPVYLRHYPHGKMLSHVLGYVGKRPPRELGPIRPNEPLWGEALGVEGIEESYDTWLKGEPGRISLLYESDGTKVREEMVRRPRPGNNIVTSIDAEMQKIAEDILKKQVKRGAFVIMDCRTGDILVMASIPQFNPNVFIPSISQEDYQRLQNDPEKPLFPRAFRGTYPPASTFKVPVALAALEEGTVTESSVFSCPPSWWVGDVQMRNWNKDPEGYMNVVGALARSCNTWFYQVGTMAGADPVTMMARRLGMGEKTGVPLKAEAEGLVPTNRWWRQKYGYYMSKGDLANICIGQGQLQASPLQVAREMAAVGNGQVVLKPRLVKQIQTYNNNVIQGVAVEERSKLDIDPYYLSVVRRGMKDVVNSGRGTGTRASHDKLEVAGKTGTGQWKLVPGAEQNVAWFAGFAPADYPVISFAVLYEGDPGEKVGGGSKAAPVVGEFLERYLENEEHLAEIRERADEVKTVFASLDSDFPDRQVSGSIFRSSSVEEKYQKPEPAAAERQPADTGGSGLTRFFRRLRGR